MKIFQVKHQKIAKYIFLPLISLIIAGLIFMILLYTLVKSGRFGTLPDKEDLLNIQNPLATEVFSADSVLMGKYYFQNRNDVDSSELTEDLINGLVATEDARFYEHKGIDTRSLFRVFFKTILMQDPGSGGGSTLSQQLAKNLYPRKKDGFLSLPGSKLREMMIARRLEDVYTKQEIIVFYLNTVPFGENTFGIKSATQRFFNKNPEELRTEEAALLVGMLKATSTYNPRKNPETATIRRNTVLNQMVKYNYLSRPLGDSLMELDLKLDYTPLSHYSGIAPYFREFLRKELEKWCSINEKENGENYNLYTDGLRVFTTIDSRLQGFAEQAVRKHLSVLQKEFNNHWKGRDIWKGKEDLLRRIAIQSEENDLEKTEQKIKLPARSVNVFSWNGEKEKELTYLDSLKYQLNFLQAGFLLMENQTGNIKAWLGGIDHRFYKFDHVLSYRQAGSVFKPVVYLAGLENGLQPCDLYPNDSVVYEEYEDWQPRNADREYGGYYSMKGALSRSVNTVSVSILLESGLDEVIETAQRLGIQKELPYVPSLALGTAEISLLEMVNAYQTIANKGLRHDPRYILKIEDKSGEILYEAPETTGKKVAEELHTELITGMLQTTASEGTASALKSSFGIEGDIAGKTGTTQNHSDGWFIGYTPEYTAGIWVGGELPHIAFRTINKGQGAYTALPVWAYFFNELYKSPEFSHLKNETFNLSEEAIDNLDCEDYYEKKPFRIFGKDPIQFIKDLFRRKK